MNHSNRFKHDSNGFLTYGNTKRIKADLIDTLKFEQGLRNQNSRTLKFNL